MAKARSSAAAARGRAAGALDRSLHCFIIVEGPGDAASMSHLINGLRRLGGFTGVQVQCYPRKGAGSKSRITGKNPPHLPRLRRGGLPSRQSDGLEALVREIRTAYRDNANLPIIALIDRENDDDAECRRMRGWAKRLGREGLGDVQVFYACGEYESWLIAAVESLTGKHGLRSELTYPGGKSDTFPSDPKRWLRERMKPGHKYFETEQQPKFTEDADWTLTQCHTIQTRNDSLRTFYQMVIAL